MHRSTVAAVIAVVPALAGIALALGAPGDVRFDAPYRPFPAGKSCCWLAAADLNGDGLLDVVMDNHGCSDYYYGNEGTITVVLGQTGGSFGAPREFDAGGYANFVTVADVDADGQVDVIANNLNATTVAVLHGNGDGTFQAPVRFDCGNGSRVIAAGDLNGDPAPDLAVAGWLPENRSNLTVLLNAGDGTFGPPTEHDLDARPTTVMIEDVSGDGRADVVVATAGGGGLSILLGNGDGTLGPRTAYFPGEYVMFASFADLDLDGKADLVAAISAANSTGISVRLGTGAGEFGERIDQPLPAVPRQFAIGDLDGDLRPDLVATIPYTPVVAVSVLRGVGDGTFLPRTDLGSGVPGTSTLDDIEADSDLDIVTTNIDQGRVVVFANNGDGTFGGGGKLPTARGPAALATADLDRDGNADLAATCTQDSVLSVFLGRGDGAFAPRADFRATWNARDFGFGDLDGDGNLDFAVTSRYALSLALGRGDGTFMPPSEMIDTRLTAALALGDLDSDAKSDLVTADDGTDVTVFLSPQGMSGSETRDWGVGGFPTSVRIADLNGDGLQDVSTVNSRSTTVSTLLGTGGGSFVRLRDSPTALGGQRHAVGDLNGDGRLDLVVACAWGNTGGFATGSVSSLLGIGDGRFDFVGAFATDFDPREIAVAELNGDGALDVVTANNAMGTISVLPGNRDGTFGPRTDFGAGAAIAGLVVADLNGDGMPEVVVGDTKTNALRVLWNRSEVVPGLIQDRADRVASQLSAPVELPSGILQIRYRLGQASDFVLLRSFDVRGRLVAILDSGRRGAGDHVVSWNLRPAGECRLPRGVYFLQLDDGSSVKRTRKFISIRR